MARGVVFSHPSIKHDLVLRLPPTEVQWSYQLNTSTTNTYAGQVVQVLSVAFDNMSITGQFGKEGPHGARVVKNRLVRRTDDNWNTPYTYGVGLVQMTAWFKEYFQIASQGTTKQNYDQRAVRLTYKGAKNIAPDEGKTESRWLIYPTSFPSYRRTNEDYAPEWRVEAEVYEAPGTLVQVEKDAAIERLKRASLYTPINKYSDPIAQFLPDTYMSKNAKTRNALIDQALIKANQASLEYVDIYNEMVPGLDIEDLRYLLLQGGSIANDVKADKQDKKKKANDRIQESTDPYRSTTFNPGARGGA
jgi:hypothetical protein